MPKIPTEPVQPPADQHVKPAPLGIADEGIESGATVLRPTHPTVNVFLSAPVPSLDIPA